MKDDMMDIQKEVMVDLFHIDVKYMFPKTW